MTATIYLQPGKDKPVRQHHPWIFSGAVARVEGEPAPGDLVDVADARGEWLARGYYNASSQIVVRLLTWRRDDVPALRRRVLAQPAGRGRRDAQRAAS